MTAGFMASRGVDMTCCFGAFLASAFCSASSFALLSFQLLQREPHAPIKANRGFKTPTAQPNENVVVKNNETKNAASNTTPAPAGFSADSNASARTFPKKPPAGIWPRTLGINGVIASADATVKPIRIIPVSLVQKC